MLPAIWLLYTMTFATAWNQRSSERTNVNEVKNSLIRNSKLFASTVVYLFTVSFMI